MKTKTTFAAIILLSLLSPNFVLLAQDSTKTEKEKWTWEFDDLGDWVNWGKKMPTISIIYGFTNITNRSISDPFSDASMLELQLGHTSRKTSYYSEKLLKYNFKYLYFSYISSDFAGSSANQNELNSKNWRIGFSGSEGYGYKLGSTAFILYTSFSFDWTKVDYTNLATNPEDQITLDRFEDGIRFGTGSDGGIRIVATPLITFDLNYQRSIAFERHLFWKWAGSAIIEEVANGLLDVFIKEIFRSSPAAGPIVNFVLKNGLAYGIYELRQEKMNWPFSSAPPLAFDSFRFGVTFTF